MMRALIVDDEAPARRRLRTLLARAPDIDIIGECVDGESAIDAIQACTPDLLFLDVQMPEMSGFDVLRAVGLDRVPVVIFVTAYDRFALQAFEAHALDYLLKPFANARFDDMLQRARQMLARTADNAALQRRIEALLANGTAATGPARIAVKSADRVLFVSTDDIDQIEAAGNYVRIHAGGAQHLVRDTLKGMAERLDPQRFVRVHNSHIVNLERVRELRPWSHGEYIVVLADGTHVTCSRSYSDRLRQLVHR